MHVLFLPSWYPTPSQPVRGTFFREQAHALSSAGVRVGVAAPQRRSLRWLFNLNAELPSGICREVDQGVPTYSHHGWSCRPFFPSFHAKLWFKSGRELFEHYVSREGMPDIIHAHSVVNGGILADELSAKYGIPYVLSEVSTLFARGLIQPRQRPAVARAFQNSSALIAASPELGELIGGQYPEVKTPWEWIPLMVDPRFQPSTSAVDQDGGAGASPRPFRWLNVALLTEKKGHRDLLTAFAKAYKGNSAHELRIGGAGPILSSLKAHAKQLGIAEQVSFLGALSRDRVLEEMQQCDAFVLSSHFETFGVVAIEALACGKPVVATRCGGPECFINTSNGILVAPRDPTALAEAMRECSDDYLRFPTLKISQACRESFGGPSIARQLRAIYERVLRGATTHNRASSRVDNTQPHPSHAASHPREKAA